MSKVSENAKAPRFARKKLVTVPLLKMGLDQPYFVTITAPIYKGKEIKSGEHKDMEAAMLAPAVNLDTGEICEFIVPSVLGSIFKEEYPNDSYVGLSFEIIKRPKGTGKRYHAFFVAEISVD